MELSFAKDGIKAASIDTGASAPVDATIENATKAIADAKVIGTGKDLALKLNRATKADGAYPITLVTYRSSATRATSRIHWLPRRRS